MNTPIYIIRVLASAVLAALLPQATTAQNPVTAYDLNVGEFTQLKVSDGVNVEYACDPGRGGKAQFECPSAMASAFMFTNKGGKLTIQLAPEYIKAKGLPTLRVYSKFITKVENHGDSTLRVAGMHGAPKFEALLEGNGRLVARGLDANEVKGTMRLGHGTLLLEGKCIDARLSLTGTGVIQADELVADNVQVNAKGTGQVGVNAVKTLKVYGLGSTTVYYVGKPEVKNSSMGIKLTPLAQ